jgi:threonine synthase
MEAISECDPETDAFELADQLCELSKVPLPNAVLEIKEAPVLHDHVCDKTEMKQTVMNFLGI